VLSEATRPALWLLPHRDLDWNPAIEDSVFGLKEVVPCWPVREAQSS
jgi:hypothetical protein